MSSPAEPSAPEPVGEDPVVVDPDAVDPVTVDRVPVEADRGNVADLLAEAAAAHPDRPAVISPDGIRTWFELEQAVHSGARQLAGLTGGADRQTHGDRVVISLPTSVDLIAALFAVARAGLVAVPVEPGRSGLPEVVARVGAALVIGGQVPGVRTLAAAAIGQWWSTEADPMPARGGGEDLAVLARATASRPVMVSHRAIRAAVRAIGAAPGLGLRTEDRAILVLPPYHLAGWVTAFLPLTLVGGTAVIPAAPEGPGHWIEGVLESIRGHRVTVVPAAPSLYRRLRAAAGAERALSSVRLMTSGAASLDPGDFAAIRALTGQSVWEGYGISEAASVVATSLMTAMPRPGSVGLPVPGLELRIVGEDGEDLAAAEPAESEPEDELDTLADAPGAGDVGRIAIRGQVVFSGYWPDGSDGPGPDGWFVTGDVGYLDDLGELHLVDRAPEAVVVAGFTVYPREVEDVLSGHPYVRDAAVVGVPGRAGSSVVAVLVPQRGTRPTEDDLNDFVADKLPVFKRPTAYLLVDRLPRTEIGRVDRDAVRRAYLAHTGERDRPTMHLAVSGPADPDEETVEAEPAGPLTDLGTRLPAGERTNRVAQDSDEDLF